MLTLIDNLLTAEQVAQINSELAQANWVDGKATAGSQSAAVKHNEQLDEHSELAVSLGQIVLRALGSNSQFLSAALPDRIHPPLFSRYSGGQQFGTHVDNAIRPISGTREVIRTDLSATLFLADPDSYEGGELVIETEFGAQAVKLEAGSLVLYPSSSLHRVEAVTRGQRLVSFFWLQSMVRDQAQRSLLFDLDQSVQRLGKELNIRHYEVVRLTGVYHNLLRQWAY